MIYRFLAFSVLALTMLAAACGGNQTSGQRVPGGDDAAAARPTPRATPTMAP
jgi:hypothetical protein